MSRHAGPTFDAFSSLIDPSNLSKAQASNLLFTALIASSSGLWHAERWPSRWLLLSISGEAGLTKSPVLFFLTQANRIRAGKSSVLIHQMWTLSVSLSTR